MARSPRHHAWRPFPAVIETEIAPERAASLPGAWCPGDKLRGQDEPSRGRYPTPIAFDHSTIIGAPASGTTTVLIANPTDLPNAIGAAVVSRQVPPGRRGVLTSIVPYLEAAAGGIQPPGRIIGATVRWTLRINGVPAGDYANITTILGTWNERPSTEPLLELVEGDALSVTFFIADAIGIYTPGGQVGVRIRGTFLPWTTDATVVVDKAIRKGKAGC